MRITPATEASFAVVAVMRCVSRVSDGGDKPCQDPDIRRAKAMAPELD